jgi:hypothetical protein
MWFGGHNGSNWRILYSTSSDGASWSTPVLAMNIGTEPNGYNSAYSYCPSVIKDGSTYKMWFGGHNGSNNRILYSIFSMTDATSSPASTTGVYTTSTPPVHLAPSADSQVIMFYEAPAVPHEANRAYMPIYIQHPGDIYVTSLGSGGTPSNMNSIGLANTLLDIQANLGAFTTYHLKGESLPTSNRAANTSYLEPETCLTKLDYAMTSYPAASVGTTPLITGRLGYFDVSTSFVTTSKNGVPVSMNYGGGYVHSILGTWVVPQPSDAIANGVFGFCMAMDGNYSDKVLKFVTAIQPLDVPFYSFFQVIPPVGSPIMK